MFYRDYTDNVDHMAVLRWYCGTHKAPHGLPVKATNVVTRLG